MKYLINKVKEFIGMPRNRRIKGKLQTTHLTKADVDGAIRHYTPPTPEERLAAKRERRKVKRQIQKALRMVNA